MTGLTRLYFEGNRNGLSMPQFAVVSAVERHGPKTGTELVGLTGIDRSTLYVMLKRLTADGILRPERMVMAKTGPDPTRFHLTVAGKRAARLAAEALAKAEKAMLDRLTPTERASFLNTLAIVAYAGPK